MYVCMIIMAWVPEQSIEIKIHTERENRCKCRVTKFSRQGIHGHFDEGTRSRIQWIPYSAVHSFYLPDPRYLLYSIFI